MGPISGSGQIPRASLQIFSRENIDFLILCFGRAFGSFFMMWIFALCFHVNFELADIGDISLFPDPNKPLVSPIGGC